MVGLYAVVLVGTSVAGPAWVWVLPVALVGQCLLLAVYAELASEFPIAGGATNGYEQGLARRLRTADNVAMRAVVAGKDLDPVTTAVVTSFGSWSSRPFAAVVLVAFLACGMSAQALTARAMYSAARDGVLPASGLLRTVNHRRAPVGAIGATAVVACLGLLLGLNSAAVGSLIAFGTAAIYVAFLLVALAALIARVRGSWRPAGGVQLGRFGLVINIAAVLWLSFETVNVAWPRRSLAPPGAPEYQVWAAPIVLVAIAVLGAMYLIVVRPHRALATPPKGPPI